MLCRVCKRELTSPICSFCGEDNSAYIKENENSGSAVNYKSAEKKDLSDKKQITKKKKYKIDYKKLIRLIVAIIIVAAAVIIIKNFLSSPKEEAPKANKSLFSSDMLGVYSGGRYVFCNESNC